MKVVFSVRFEECVFLVDFPRIAYIRDSRLVNYPGALRFLAFD